MPFKVAAGEDDEDSLAAQIERRHVAFIQNAAKERQPKGKQTPTVAEFEALLEAKQASQEFGDVPLPRLKLVWGLPVCLSQSRTHPLFGRFRYRLHKNPSLYRRNAMYL
jgi:hypothetical protein